MKMKIFIMVILEGGILSDAIFAFRLCFSNFLHKHVYNQKGTFRNKYISLVFLQFVRQMLYHAYGYIEK